MNNPKQEQLATVLEEMGRRREALESIPEFVRYMRETGLPDFEYLIEAKHHRHICELLEAVERGEIKKLLIMQPPGTGKSFLVSVIFVCWWMAKHSRSRVLAMSNTLDLAVEFSRRRRMALETDEWQILSGTLLDKTRLAADNFALEAGGTCRAFGSTGTPTGLRSDLSIADDLVSNWEQAHSDSQMEKLWNTYSSVWRSRMVKDAPEIMISTAWTTADPSQRIVRAFQEGLEPDWHVCRLPWECDDKADPLGRDIGEPLWSGHFSESKLRDVKANPKDFQAYWQQRPTDDSSEWYPISELPTGSPPADQNLVYYLGIDISLTVGKGDYTALVVVGLDADRNLWICDIERFREPSSHIIDRIVALNRKYKFRERFIENDGYSKAFSQHFYERMRIANEFVHLRVAKIGNRSKEERASGLRSLLWQGRVRLVPGPHASAFIKELGEFPGCVSGSPDQVDALCTVVNSLPVLNAGSVDKPAEAKPSIKFSAQVDESGQIRTTATLEELWDDHERYRGDILRI